MNLENIDNNKTPEKLISKIEIETRIKDIKEILAKGGNTAQEIKNLLIEQSGLEGKLVRSEYID